MLIFNKSDRILYIKSKESFLQQIPNINKLRGVNTKQLQKLLNDFEQELIRLKHKLEFMDTIPNVEWRETTTKLNQKEREITYLVNKHIVSPEQARTK